MLEPLALPTTRPRGQRRTYRYGRSRRELPAALTGELRWLAREHDATPFMVLLAGVNALLRRNCGQSDLRVGTVVANRNRPDTERIVGLLANTVVARIEYPAGLTGDELLSRVRRATLEAYARQELPFETLLEQLRRRHDLARETPFQVLLVSQNNPAPTRRAGDLWIRPAPEITGAGDAPEFTLSTFDWIIEADERPRRPRVEPALQRRPVRSRRRRPGARGSGSVPGAPGRLPRCARPGGLPDVMQTGPLLR